MDGDKQSLAVFVNVTTKRNKTHVSYHRTQSLLTIIDSWLCVLFCVVGILMKMAQSSTEKSKQSNTIIPFLFYTVCPRKGSRPINCCTPLSIMF